MRAHNLNLNLESQSQSRSGTRKVFEMILILIAKTDNQIEYTHTKHKGCFSLMTLCTSTLGKLITLCVRLALVRMVLS